MFQKHCVVFPKHCFVFQELFVAFADMGHRKFGYGEIVVRIVDTVKLCYVPFCLGVLGLFLFFFLLRKWHFIRARKGTVSQILSAAYVTCPKQYDNPT